MCTVKQNEAAEGNGNGLSVVEKGLPEDLGSGEEYSRLKE